MKLNIFKNSVESFGLDISGSSAKIVQLKRAGKTWKLQCFSTIPVPKGVISNDVVLDSDGLSKLIIRGLDSPDFGHVSTPYVHVSLPESKSFVRIIHIPVMSEQAADQAVLFEAESYIPIPIDQVYLDWQPTGRVDEARMEVLIIATPIETVDKFLSTVQKAHLRPTALEVGSQSILRSVIADTSEETTLVVDLGTNRTNLIMVEQGTLQFSSSIPVAGNTFTESIARFLGITNSKAEAIKDDVGIANTTEYPNIKIALLPILNNLGAEIKNVLKFHNEHSKIPATKILLCGGSAKMKHLAEFLMPEFSDIPGLVVEVADPLKVWQGKVDLGKLNSYNVLDYTTALGLALRPEGY